MPIKTIGVSRDVTSTKVVEALAELHPIRLDLWDRQEMSRLLRGASEIVVEFFGLPTAKAFCLPFEMEAVRVPTADAVAIREALARTPEETTGAATLLWRGVGRSRARLGADRRSPGKLRAAGFASYAVQHEDERTRLLSGEHASPTWRSSVCDATAALAPDARRARAERHHLSPRHRHHGPVAMAVAITLAAYG